MFSNFLTISSKTKRDALEKQKPREKYIKVVY